MLFRLSTIADWPNASWKSISLQKQTPHITKKYVLWQYRNRTLKCLLNGKRGVLILLQKSRFSNVLLRANLATDKIDVVVCATRRVAQYLEGTTRNGTNTILRVDAVLPQKVSRQVWKSPLGNGLSNLALPIRQKKIARNPSGNISISIITKGKTWQCYWP